MDPPSFLNHLQFITWTSCDTSYDILCVPNITHLTQIHTLTHSIIQTYDILDSLVSSSNSLQNPIPIWSKYQSIKTPHKNKSLLVGGWWKKNKKYKKRSITYRSIGGWNRAHGEFNMRKLWQHLGRWPRNFSTN